jgi:hypothetical protein
MIPTAARVGRQETPAHYFVDYQVKNVFTKVNALLANSFSTRHTS